MRLSRKKPTHRGEKNPVGCEEVPSDCQRLSVAQHVQADGPSSRVSTGLSGLATGIGLGGKKGVKVGGDRCQNAEERRGTV